MTETKYSKETRVFNPSQDALDFQFDYNTEETVALKNLLRRNPTPTVADLRRVALWKIDRVLDVPEETMKQLGQLVSEKNLSHKSESSKAVLTALVACPGIGFPMASAILKFLRPDIFPIIDVRAYRALKGKKLYPSSYSYDLYIKYIDELLEIAKTKNMPLHQIDEQLYCFDREHNGSINS